MPARYDAYQFVLSLNGTPVGGFSEAAGFGDNPRRLRRTSTITLKRGLVDLEALAEWMRAGQDATLTMFDASRKPTHTWTIRAAIPEKHTGPALAARGGGDVAMEELVLSAEGIETAATP